jgi:hypothetical protein
MAQLARNLIGGTAIMTANHLDFFLEDNIPTALRAINLDLHDLSSHLSRVVPVTRFSLDKRLMECWSVEVLERARTSIAT